MITIAIWEVQGRDAGVLFIKTQHPAFIRIIPKYGTSCTSQVAFFLLLNLENMSSRWPRVDTLCVMHMGSDHAVCAQCIRRNGSIENSFIIVVRPY